MTTKPKKNRAVIIFISVFLAAVITLGAVLGIISAVRYSNAVVEYNGVTVNHKIASFFISRLKVEYLSEYSGADNDGFWNSELGDGVTYRQDFERIAEQHLKEIAVTNYMFDSIRSLTAEEKTVIKNTVADVLDLQAGGSVEKFNEIAGKYGFDYSSFCDAAQMYYKTAYAFDVLYGSEGINISQDATVCGSYLNEYSHVSLIFVRERTKLKGGSEGESERNVYLDENELAEREEYIDKLHAALEAYKNGGDGQMSAESFEKWLMDEENSATMWRNTGYYFNEDAATTKEFSKMYPGIAEKAYEMELYSFDELELTVPVEMEDGTEISEKMHVFMYKYPVADGAYADKDMSEYWFSDFYENASVYLYLNLLEEYSAAATLGGYAEKFDYVGVKENEEIFIRSFVYDK